MIRDTLREVRNQMEAAQPPGVSSIDPAPSNLGSGAVSFDPSSQVFGAFEGRMRVVVAGLPGTARAELSLDGGNNYDGAFTLPVDLYAVPLPPISPGHASPGLSGLVLSFSGSFSSGDAFSFSAFPQVTHLVGEEEVAGQDTLFPRVVHVLGDSSFRGTDDFAQGRDQRTQPRSLCTDVANFETHCWGLDYDRTELLRDLLVNGIHFALLATGQVLGGFWADSTARIGKSGQLYILRWSAMKPLVVLNKDTRPLGPPFTATLASLVVQSP